MASPFKIPSKTPCQQGSKPKGNCDLSCSDSIPRNIISCELVAKPLRLRARRATQRMRLMRGGCAGDKRGLCGERFCLIGMFERVIVCFGRNELAPIISHLWRGQWEGRASPRVAKKVLVSCLRACSCFAVSGLSARQGNGKPILNFVALPNCCRIRSYEFESQS